MLGFFLELTSIVALATGALGKEMAPDEVKGALLYESGQMHRNIMALKESSWEKQRAAGRYVSSQYLALNYTKCVDGVAVAVPGDKYNTFKCSNIDLYHFLSHAELGSKAGQGASSWGWTSPTGREFVAIAQSDGAAFAEISPEGKLIYLGRLPPYSVDSEWREIRGYKNYIVIGSEAEKHGIQIFDMSKLINIDPKTPKTFSNQKDLSGYFGGLPVGRTHNVVVNEGKNYAVAVGAVPRDSGCRGGLLFIDLTDLSNLTSPGCASLDGYVHDAQCIEYKGPDTKYVGHDICYGYNENKLTIYDVSDKKNVKIISRTSYQGAQYTHQGWVLDPQNQQYLLLDDEYDEYNNYMIGQSAKPLTYIWDISSLEKPKQTGQYRSGVVGIDHNQYVHDGFSYQSNYNTGLRILDVRSIPQDPTGKGVKEVAYFDVFPEDDGFSGGGLPDFVGTWSSYSYFKSGYILINSIERGAFVVKRTN